MATKRIDKDLLEAARSENKEYIKNGGKKNREAESSQSADANQQEQQQQAGQDSQAQNNQQENTTQSQGQSSGQQQSEQQQSGQQSSQQSQQQQRFTPPQDDFEKKFQEFFKGLPVGGALVTDLIDDWKQNLLVIHAKKNGVDLEKSAFKMDEKTRNMCTFLIDHGMKDKFLEWIKEHPFISAGLLVLLSAGSSVAFINMMKDNSDKAKKAEAAARKEKEENDRLRAEIEKMKKEAQDKARAQATDAELVTEEKADIIAETIQHVNS